MGGCMLPVKRGLAYGNESTQDWDYPMAGLPLGNRHRSDEPPVYLDVCCSRRSLYAGLQVHGVYVFDSGSETWSSTGIEGTSVYSLVSHGSGLYAGHGGKTASIIWLKSERLLLKKGASTVATPSQFLEEDFPTGTTVTIGGKPVTDLRVTNTLITGLTPPGVLGETDIEIRVFLTVVHSLLKGENFFTRTPHQ